MASTASPATGLSHALLANLTRFVESRIGLHFPEERFRDLERGICCAAHDFGFEDAESCISWLLSCPLSQAQIEILASHLTVGETYFFRDKAVFDFLESQVLPEWIESRRGKEQRIRIWSAGCATGEEAFSMAILLYKMIPDLTSWNITIQATDINPHFLKKASEGVYGEWSFRDPPQGLKERHFTKTPRGYELLAQIRKMVLFSYHNLATDPYPALINNTSAMDLIFCRNVMLYFHHKRAAEVVQNMHRCLVDSGLFILSPVEVSNDLLLPLFAPVNSPAAVFRKAQVPETPIVREATVAPCNAVGHPHHFQHAPCAIPDRQVSTVAASPSETARALANQGKLSEALECCAQAIRADKLNAFLYFLHANILQEMGRLEDAAREFRRVIYIDNSIVLAHYSMGHLLHQQGKHQEAEKHFANACHLLSRYGQDEILPESEGISTRRLLEIIQNTRNQQVTV